MAFQIRVMNVLRSVNFLTAVAPGRLFQISMSRPAGQALASLASSSWLVKISVPFVSPALACLFPPAEEGERWRALLFFWVPEERLPEIERRTKSPLSMWIRQKFVTAIPGSAVDLREIEKKVKWAAELFDLREVTFDPWGGMRQSAKNLIGEGLLCVEVRQGYPTLSAPTKKFIELYMNQQLEHCNNPVLNWNASCLALLSDGSDNVKPAKPARDTASKRIDGVAAIITAWTRATAIEAEAAETPRLRWI